MNRIGAHRFAAILLLLFFFSPAVWILAAAGSAYSEESSRILPHSIQEKISGCLEIPLDRIRLDPRQMRLSSNVSLPPIHETLIQAPLDSLDMMDRFVTILVENSSRLENSLNNASILLDQRIGSIPAFDWADSSASIESFVKKWSALAGYLDNAALCEKRQEAERRFHSLPLILKKAINHILEAVVQSKDWMALGRDSIDAVRPMIELEDVIRRTEISPQEIDVLEQLAQRADRKAIFRAGAIMASSLGEL
ncbi:MAG: hypothetical protein JXR73_11775, partial [Candidatus Omnitrophica bacterium]|nr:hypothetical protein [Candidatus Omnitrophota bacterium]